VDDPQRLLVRVPKIGDFEDVAVIEVLVVPGERVEEEQSLVTLESDKASLEVPSPAAGVVVELRVAEGARVREGSPLLVLALDAPAAARGAPGAGAPAPSADAPPADATRSIDPAASTDAVGEAGPASAPPAATSGTEECAGAAAHAASAPTRRAGEIAPGARETAARPDGPARPRAAGPERVDVVVLGGGPGGYTAAFRAADLGLRVTLVERDPFLGGVCLHVGCIPSKALLHVAEVMRAADALAAAGVRYGAPRVELPRLRAHQHGVVKRLADGLGHLARQRGVEVLTGFARFESPHAVRVEGPDGARSVAFEHAIVAVGSRPVELPGAPKDPRIWTSTEALALDGVPARLLVVGGGVIGLEMATVYAALGARVSIVELLPELLPGVDPDLVRPLRATFEPRCEAIWCGTRVRELRAERDGLYVRLEGPKAPAEAVFERALVAVGRTGRADEVAPERAGLQPDARGYLAVDAEQRTSQAHIFAIGDVTGPPLLAHRATHQGKVAAEVIAGLPAAFEPAAVPNVAYTDPEIAWAGLTESEAKAREIAYEKAVFPWSASGRALGLARPEGFTKLLFEPGGGRLLGAGLVGPHAGDLVSEAVVALELGADAEDLALSIHPHPTLSETLGLAAELGAGSITDLLPPKRGRR